MALREEKAVGRFQRCFVLLRRDTDLDQAAEMRVALWDVPDAEDRPAHLGAGHRAQGAGHRAEMTLPAHLSTGHSSSGCRAQGTRAQCVC